MQGCVMSETNQMAESIIRLLDDNQLQAVKTNYADGETIFAAGKPATNFYIIESGEVHVFASMDARKHDQLLDIFGPRQCFGFTALGRLPNYGKTTKSVGPSVLYVIDANHLRQVIAARSDLTLQLVETMARQLYLSWAAQRDFVCSDCRHRLIKALLRFRNSPVAEPGADGVRLHMTHAQLAEAIGVARETVSTCLIQLRHENLVQTGRNCIIFNPLDLSRICPEDNSLPSSTIAV
jgi:CRP/FNR family cyclic AMP-dependent transcriptional regulator